MKPPLRISAGPLRLRLLRSADVEPCLANRSDPAVARVQGWYAMDRETALDFLREVSAPGPWQLGEWQQIAKARAADDRLFGDIALLLEAPQKVQSGISLAQPAQGQGWAATALRALIDSLPGVRWRATSDSRNAASLSLFSGLGFEEQGREAVVVKGDSCIDVTLMREAGAT